MIFLLRVLFVTIGWAGKAAPVPERYIGMLVMQEAVANLNAPLASALAIVVTIAGLIFAGLCTWGLNRAMPWRAGTPRSLRKNGAEAGYADCRVSGTPPGPAASGQTRHADAGASAATIKSCFRCRPERRRARPSFRQQPPGAKRTL